MTGSDKVFKDEIRPASQKFDGYQVKSNTRRPKIQCHKCSMHFPNTLELEEHMEYDHRKISS